MARMHIEQLYFWRVQGKFIALLFLHQLLKEGRVEGMVRFVGEARQVLQSFPLCAQPLIQIADQVRYDQEVDHATQEKQCEEEDQHVPEHNSSA
jgi:hypothetical protein